MKYQNYIFDLYGTLVDIWTEEKGSLFWQRVALWFKKHGADWEKEALQARYLALCDKEQKSMPDPLAEIELRKVFTALFAERGVQADAFLVEETACFFRITSQKKLERYPWVGRVFPKIRAAGGKIYLLSNAQACFTERELLALKLADKFDGIVLSSDVAIRKPSPRIMEILLSRYGLDPKDCIMTGNDPQADIALAEHFGMESLYIQTATSQRAPGGAHPPHTITKRATDKREELRGL